MVTGTSYLPNFEDALPLWITWEHSFYDRRPASVEHWLDLKSRYVDGMSGDVLKAAI